MNKKTKTLILSIVVTLVLLLTFTITYAAFSYMQTGTNNQQLVLGDIYMHYQEVNAIGIEGALPGDDYSEYFEFKISGKNTYKQKDIYYDVVLSKGEVPDGKTETNRIPDEYLKFKLVEVSDDNSETIIFTDKTYNDLTNKRIWVETIPKNTTNEYKKTYRLYMVISENLIIGNTEDAVMTTEDFQKVFASIKVNVTGDFNKKVVAENFVSAVKGRYGTDTTLVAVNTDGDLYDGTGEIREYRYSGATANNYVFFDTDGDGEKDTNEVWRIVGVFKDTVKDEEGNVVNDAGGNPTYEEEVKLVRNTLLQSSEMPTSYLIDGTTYTIKNSSVGVHWNDIPSTYPSNNDWTKAGLQYYLNTEQDETNTSDGTTTANAGYLSLLTTEAKELISPTTYYLGNVDYNVSTVKLSYNQERDETRKWTDNQPSWDGLIGLMYPSDYGYSASNLYWETDMEGWHSAESDGIKASSTSWMQQTLGHSRGGEWFLSPASIISDDALYWLEEGHISVNYVYYDYYGSNRVGVRPVLNLKSGAKVIDGAGTEEEPFEVVIE
ncbi:MAG: hypothetical protein IJ501_05550 [Bacilli bacterium]|nr:hypothetical protein [Bacilli bacterium]